ERQHGPKVAMVGDLVTPRLISGFKPLVRRLVVDFSAQWTAVGLRCGPGWTEMLVGPRSGLGDRPVRRLRNGQPLPGNAVHGGCSRAPCRGFDRRIGDHQDLRARSSQHGGWIAKVMQCVGVDESRPGLWCAIVI